MASNNTSAAVTQELLARAHSPDNASRVYAEKIQHRPLYLRPNSPPPPDARDARRRERRKQQQNRQRAPKPKPLSARQRRALGLHDVAAASAAKPSEKPKPKYATFAPLHRLWLGYAREILGGGSELYAGGQGAAAKLSAADFHGARVRVVRSRCPSRVGLAGLVIRDTRFSFELVTPRDQVKLVPKEGTVFRVEVPVEGAEAAAEEKELAAGATVVAAPEGEGDRRGVFTFDIHGDQFQYRSADRSNKKFKAHFLKNL